MTFGELKELIAELDEQVADDAPVMMATQPSWPLAAYVRQLRLVGDTLWIAEGGSPYDAPYAPRAAWNSDLDDEEDEAGGTNW
jgi:hypothetical protein